MKTAIFYDLENLGLPIKNGEFEAAFTALVERVRSNALVGEIALQRAYTSKNGNTLSHIMPIMRKLGVELVAVEPFSDKPSRKKANLVDFKMAVDVAATVSSKRSITTVAIASGDNDFGFLCQKIKEMGRRLVVISSLAVTGEAMLMLCDDWISLSGDKIAPKFILKFINARISTNYNGDSEFFASLSDFHSKLESDPLVCRCMAEAGLSTSVFIDILRGRGLVFPCYEKLGFLNITAFLAALLRDTSFRVSGGRIVYIPGSKPPSLRQLAGGLLNIPGGYSREKLLRYYDAVNAVGDADELVRYIGFMKRSGMLSAKGLCPKRTFRATIRAHLKQVLATAGIALDEKTLSELNKRL